MCHYKGRGQHLTTHFLPSLSLSPCGQFLMTCSSREYSPSHSGSVGQCLNTEAGKQDVCRVWKCQIGAAQRHRVRMLQHFLAQWFLLPVWVRMATFSLSHEASVVTSTLPLKPRCTSQLHEGEVVWCKKTKDTRREKYQVLYQKCPSENNCLVGGTQIF